MSRFEDKHFGDFGIGPDSGGFYLDAYYHNEYYRETEVTLDAVDVYQKLKEYFKGTEYE